MNKMTCPHCAGEMNLLSKAISTIARRRSCPACGKGVKLSLRLRKTVLVFVPLAVFGIFITRDTPVSCGVAAAIAAYMGLRFEPV